MKLLDPDHPFFRPVWVRVAVVGLALLWAVVELVFGSPGWAMLFAAAGPDPGLMAFRVCAESEFELISFKF